MHVLQLEDGLHELTYLFELGVKEALDGHLSTEDRDPHRLVDLRPPQHTGLAPKLLDEGGGETQIPGGKALATAAVDPFTWPRRDSDIYILEQYRILCKRYYGFRLLEHSFDGIYTFKVIAHFFFQPAV